MIYVCNNVRDSDSENWFRSVYWWIHYQCDLEDNRAFKVLPIGQHGLKNIQYITVSLYKKKYINFGYSITTDGIFVSVRWLKLKIILNN